MKCTLLLFILIGFTASAQKFSIKGVVSDTSSNPMASATVMLLNPKDSSLVNFDVTSSTGAFEIKNVNKGSYQLKISFVGFATFTRNFSTPETGMAIDLGKLKLQSKSQDLADVVIKGERNPVTVKRDTIEFNASSFKTKVNANVEDLLKKMPGIEVESDGTINAQGEQVQQVTVDGREFFGRDPKLATRNLPADAVDKVQVFDKKSDQTQFTGIDDGQKTKTINLELKEEKRNAAFGNMMAGYGSNNRYQAKASINRFNKGSQFSFLGMGNNINEQGFSIGDAMNFSGGGQQMMGGGGGAVTIQVGGGGNSTVPTNFGGRQNGIMTNYAGGINFNQDFNKQKTKIGGNYFYSWLEQNIIDTLNRINYFPNQPVNYYNQGSTQLSNSESHKVNLIVDHKIDSANSLKLTSNLGLTNSEQTNKLTSKTLREDGSLIGYSNSNTLSTLTNQSTTNNLLWRHRFEKKGRTLSTNLTFNYSLSNNESLQRTSTFDDANVEKKKVNQRNEQETINTTAGGSVSYTEPLGNRKYLEINYNYRANINKLDRPSFDSDTGSRIDSLSNQYTSQYNYNKPGLNLRVNRQKYNFSLGASYQSSRLKGDLISADTTINRVFNRFLPAAHFNYDFTSFKHLRLDYETSMQEPSVRQLQPFYEPSTDQINFYQGNPELKPANVQTVNLHFTTFDPVKFINFFALGNLNYQTDAIVNSQRQALVDGQLRRYTKPVNVKDALNASLNLNFGFRLTKLLSRFNLGSNISTNKSVTILNDQANTINTQTVGGNVRYNFTFKEIFTIDLAANIRNTATKYDFNTQNNQRYINSTYTAETNITLFKNYQLNADFNYYMYDSKTTNFSQTIPILNVWLSRFILKANAGEIKVGVSNLLDRSLSVTQTASANYLQQETINNLGRYIMVSFTYALNKQLNPFGGGSRRPGGMRMMMRMD